LEYGKGGVTVVNVIKKKGNKEVFSEAKLKMSITSAVRDAGLKVEDRMDLINRVSMDVSALVRNKTDVKSNEIRGMVLDRLKKKDAKVAKAWEDYEKKKKTMKK
jgi:transcriptional regulator NrdR family protein